MSANTVKLTETVQKGGCAAKVAAAELRKILSQVKFPPKQDDLLVDGSLFDDAAIIKAPHKPNWSLVQTVDFFTPMLDTPYIFGQVAAANAMSDVYAMGGAPKQCLAILAFPLSLFETETVVQILQGACDKMAEAGAQLVGGHSIDDDTLKFGLSVTGYVDTDKVWSNAGAKVGDQLILTKPLGTGTMMAAIKSKVKTEEEVFQAVQSMVTLNNVTGIQAHAATDVTGFGLVGHGLQMAKASGVKLSIQLPKVPYFDLVPECFEKNCLTKAHRTNWEYANLSQELGKFERLLVTDPQTSGGLLLSVGKENSLAILKDLKKKFPKAAIIGEVMPHTSGDSIEFIP